MPRLPFPALGLLAAAAVAFLSGCAEGNVVFVRDDAFDPDRMQVERGAAVEFSNGSLNRHTVTIHDPSGQTVHDKELPQGGSLTYRFGADGTYHVFCRYHEGMRLTVTTA